MYNTFVVTLYNGTTHTIAAAHPVEAAEQAVQEDFLDYLTEQQYGTVRPQKEMTFQSWELN